MKELSIEEKAKAYDEAIEQLRTMMPNWESLSYNGKTFLQDLVHIIPELKENKESEDEQIRKRLIQALHGDVLNMAETVKAVAWIEKQGEQKPTIEMITPEESLGTDSETYNKIVDECVYGEPNPAWSEEDKDFMYDTLSNLTELKDRYGEGYGNVGKCIDWLKSLKERYTWKPSDEQMNALNYVVNLMASSERPTENDLYYNILKSLREQLKKLK